MLFALSIDANSLAPTTTTVSTKQGLDVNIIGGSFSTGAVDLSTFTFGTSSQQPIGGVFDDTPPTAVATGKTAAARITANRALHMNLRTQAGAEFGSTQALGINVILGDGTNVPAVKAASVAAVAADKALVVSVSPNTPILLGAGTAIIGKVSQDNTVQWLTQDLADGPVTPGTAAGKSMLSGLIANSTSPTATAGQQLAMQADLSGNLKVVNQNDNASSAALSNASVTSTTTPVLSANAARKGAIIYNAGANAAFLAYAATAGLTAFTEVIPVGGTYVLDKNYTGALSAICSSLQTSTLRVTELS